MMPSVAEPHRSMPRLLVADDQPHILSALEFLFRDQGYIIEFAASPAAVLNALQNATFDAVVMDLNYTRDTTGGGEGLELVSQIRALDETLPMIVMTAWSSVNLAVEAMRRGAADFVQKPWSNSELLQKVQEQVECRRTMRHSQRLKEEESREAREIQNRLLPRVIPEVAGCDISATTQSARFIGGDYYDVIRIDDTHIAFCIADAAGKGLPGALLMSNLQAALRPLIHQALDSHEVCNRLNRLLCDVMPVSKFISLFYGVLDTSTNRLAYCNAGHNPPLLLRTDGTVEELNHAGAVLGQFPAWDYVQAEVVLQRGDTLLLFTDGVVEASNERGEQFGEQRLADHVRAMPAGSTATLLASLLEQVSAHCSRQFQDDATMIVLRVEH